MGSSHPPSTACVALLPVSVSHAKTRGCLGGRSSGQRQVDAEEVPLKLMASGLVFCPRGQPIVSCCPCCLSGRFQLTSETRAAQQQPWRYQWQGCLGTNESLLGLVLCNSHRKPVASDTRSFCGPLWVGNPWVCFKLLFLEAKGEIDIRKIGLLIFGHVERWDWERVLVSQGSCFLIKPKNIL